MKSAQVASLSASVPAFHCFWVARCKVPPENHFGLGVGFAADTIGELATFAGDGVRSGIVR
jgi:hypothetical protein